MMLALATILETHHFPAKKECQYIEGDPRAGGYFCCAPIDVPGSYCEKHRKICYREIGETR